MDTVLWLCPLIVTETFKWLSSLPSIMQKSFRWWQYSVRFSLPLLPPTSWDLSPRQYLLRKGLVLKHFKQIWPCVGMCDRPWSNGDSVPDQQREHSLWLPLCGGLLPLRGLRLPSGRGAHVRTDPCQVQVGVPATGTMAVPYCSSLFQVAEMLTSGQFGVEGETVGPMHFGEAIFGQHSFLMNELFFFFVYFINLFPIK